MKTVLTVVVALMLSMGGYAQTVTQSDNGAVIDCSAMKSDAITKTKKARTTTGTNSTAPTESAADIGSSINDEKIYYKLEVSGIDGYINNLYWFAWREAIDLCANLTTGGFGWRLPTQRELMLMWVLSPELNKIAGFTQFHTLNPYRSATHVRSSNFAWCMNFRDGSTYDSMKNYGYRVRCVRDI